MSYLELLQENPVLFVIWLFISLALTLLIYGAFPFIFAKVRKTPITKKKYKRLCYGLNIIGIIFFCVLNEKVSGGAYFLWTWVFSNYGVKLLKERNVLDEENVISNNEIYNDKLVEVSGQLIPQAPSLSRQVSKSNVPNQAKIRRTKKSINKKSLLYLIVALFTIAIIIILIIFVLVPRIKYGHAQKLLEDGNYELAYSAFQQLDGFSDSEDMLFECRYVQAIKYRDAGDFEVANKIFESLGDYRDSKILIHNHEYKIISCVAATCTVAGSDTYKCSGCEDTYVKSVTQTHSYVLHSSEEASCQKDGYKTFVCTLCDEEYTENIKKTSHNAVLTRTQEATCSNVGAKYYKCSSCGFEYSEEIPKKTHSFIPANCYNPKTCSKCGATEGKALGHTTGIECSRCGKITFETLYYSGTGSKVIDYTVPKGKFKITVTMTDGKGSVDVKVHYTSTYGETYKWFYIIEAGNSEVEYVDGLTSGTIVVNAADYQGISSWVITIEAVKS